MDEDVERLVSNALRGTFDERDLTEAFWDEMKGAAKDKMGAVSDRLKRGVSLTKSGRNRATADLQLRNLTNELYQGWVKWSRGAGDKPATLPNLTQFLKVQGIPDALVQKYYSDAGYGGASADAGATGDAAGADAAGGEPKDDRQGEMNFDAPKTSKGSSGTQNNAPPAGGTTPPDGGGVSPDVEQKIMNSPHIPPALKDRLSKMAPEDRSKHIAYLVKRAKQNNG